MLSALICATLLTPSTRYTSLLSLGVLGLLSGAAAAVATVKCSAPRRCGSAALSTSWNTVALGAYGAVSVNAHVRLGAAAAGAKNAARLCDV